jgi:hypothetical protein
MAAQPRLFQSVKALGEGPVVHGCHQVTREENVMNGIRIPAKLPTKYRKWEEVP